MRAARQFAAVGNPIHSRGSLITTDNGDLACDDVAGRVLERLTANMVTRPDSAMR